MTTILRSLPTAILEYVKHWKLGLMNSNRFTNTRTYCRIEITDLIEKIWCHL